MGWINYFGGDPPKVVLYMSDFPFAENLCESESEALAIAAAIMEGNGWTDEGGNRWTKTAHGIKTEIRVITE